VPRPPWPTTSNRQKVSNKKSSSGAVVGGIAILLALGLTGGLYLHGHQSAVAQQAELGPQAATGRGHEQA
jgi:uncharacterized protein HemX